MEQTETRIDDNAFYVVLPMQHLQVIMKQYLWQVGAIAPEQPINSVTMPIDVDEENNITVKVWLPISGSIN